MIYIRSNCVQEPLLFLHNLSNVYIYVEDQYIYFHQAR